MIRKFACLLLILSASPAVFGYWTETYGWDDLTSIVMQLELGPTNVALQDGTGTWNGSAADALSLWNQYLEIIQFESVANSTATKLSGDGYNSAFFSDSVFGDGFGEDVLAVTVYLQNDGIESEADVVVNQFYQFNSYRGPLQGPVYDIHRVLLHEFGHVLGFDHPDDHGEEVDAIMNSVIGDLDHLTDDDIAAATDLYGIKIIAEPIANFFVGQPVSYQLSANVPTATYSAANLPPGLSLASKTGVISGVCPINGQYIETKATAHGLKTTSQMSLTFNILDDPPMDLRGEYYFSASDLAVDYVHNRVYASVNDPPGLAVFDTTQLALLKTIPLTRPPFGLAISPDETRLYVSESDSTDGSAAIGVVDLETLSSLPDLPAAVSSGSMVAGLDNRLYAATSVSIAQIDTVSGVVTSPFTRSVPHALLALAPDFKTLYVVSLLTSLSSYDVSGSSPVLLQQVTYTGYPSPLGDFKLSHDGSFILCNGLGAISDLRLSASDFNTTLNRYVIPGANLIDGTLVSGSEGAISPDNSTVFVSIVDRSDNRYGLNAYDVFDATSGEYLRQTAKDEFYPFDTVVDSSGKYLFVAGKNIEQSAQLRVHATGSDVAPAHPPKPQSLLNVSTRMKSQSGDDVLIGGFIIAGTDPKQIAIRGMGSSLPVIDHLGDPTLNVYDQSGKLIASNDNWNSNRASVLATGLAPLNEHEAATVLTVAPGSYTVTVGGAYGGSGVALVEVYDLTPDTTSALANISTRGDVETGDDVMIGGFIIGADTPTKVLLRAIGPSLAQQGLTGLLEDPVLELHDSDGNIIASNDNWRSTQASEIIATTIPPSDDREAAIVSTLDPGNYTAIVHGKGDATGVALVEIYNLDSGSSISN